jgi:hypothetical protein
VASREAANLHAAETPRGPGGTTPVNLPEARGRMVFGSLRGAEPLKGRKPREAPGRFCGLTPAGLATVFRRDQDLEVGLRPTASR